MNLVVVCIYAYTGSTWYVKIDDASTLRALVLCTIHQGPLRLPLIHFVI